MAPCRASKYFRLHPDQPIFLRALLAFFGFLYLACFTLFLSTWHGPCYSRARAHICSSKP